MSGTLDAPRVQEVTVVTDLRSNDKRVLEFLFLLGLRNPDGVRSVEVHVVGGKRVAMTVRRQLTKPREVGR